MLVIIFRRCSPVSRLICAKEATEIVEVRDISWCASDSFLDFLYRRGQLRLTAPGDEDVRAFFHELLRRREVDAAITTGNECNFSFKLAHAQSPSLQRG
jgi:hypothetical protein